MKKIILIVIIMTLALLSIKEVTANTIIEIKGDGIDTNPEYNDTMVKADSDREYGQSPFFYVGGSSSLEHRILLYVPVKQITFNATIINANITFTKVGYSRSPGDEDIDSTFIIKRVTRAWSEGQCSISTGCTRSSYSFGANWYDWQYLNNWDNAGIDFNETNYSSLDISYSDVTNPTFTWDITTLVNGWHNGTYDNYGLILYEPNEENNAINYLKLYTGETSYEDKRPLITVEYSVNQSYSGSPKPIVELSSPGDNTIINDNPTSLSVTIFGYYDNVTLYHNANGTFIKNSTTTGLSWSESLQDGNITWNAYGCNNNNCTFADSNWTFILDTVNPIVNLVSPANGYIQNDNYYFTGTYNVTDTTLGISRCDLMIDSQSKGYSLTITEGTSQQITSSILIAGSHTWTVRCEDQAGNTYSPPTRTFTITTTPPPPPPGEANTTDLLLIQQSDGTNVTRFSNKGDIIASGNITADYFIGYINCEYILGADSSICRGGGIFDKSLREPGDPINDSYNLSGYHSYQWDELIASGNVPEGFVDGSDDTCNGIPCDLSFGYDFAFSSLDNDTFPTGCEDGYAISSITPTSFTCELVSTDYEVTEYLYDFAQSPINIHGSKMEGSCSDPTYYNASYSCATAFVWTNLTTDAALDASDDVDEKVDNLYGNIFFFMDTVIPTNIVGDIDELEYGVELDCGNNGNPYEFNVYNFSAGSWYNCYDFYDSSGSDTLVTCNFDNEISDFINSSTNHTYFKLSGVGLGDCYIDYAYIEATDTVATTPDYSQYDPTNIAFTNETNNFTQNNYFDNISFEYVINNPIFLEQVNFSKDVTVDGMIDAAGDVCGGAYCLSDPAPDRYNPANIAFTNESNIFSLNQFFSQNISVGRVNLSKSLMLIEGTLDYRINMTHKDRASPGSDIYIKAGGAGQSDVVTYGGGNIYLDGGTGTGIGAPGGSIYLCADTCNNIDMTPTGNIYLKPSGDTDDYILIYTSSNEATIDTGGASDLNIFSSGDVDIVPVGDNVRVGTTSSSTDFEVEDGGVCIGDGGCNPPADSHLVVQGDLSVGTTTISPSDFYVVASTSAAMDPIAEVRATYSGAGTYGIGLLVNATGTNTGGMIGIYGNAIHTNANNAQVYGIAGEAYGESGDTCYGGSFFTTGCTTNNGIYLWEDLLASTNAIPGIAGTNYLCWDGAGDSYWGDCTSLFDLKKDITNQTMNENKWDMFMNLQPVTYRWKSNDSIQTLQGGFIAEWTEAVHPMFTTYKESPIVPATPYSPASEETTTELVGINYDTITAFNTAAIQDLKEENEMLKEELCTKDPTYSWC